MGKLTALLFLLALTGCSTANITAGLNLHLKIPEVFIEDMPENDQVVLFLCGSDPAKEAILLDEDESIYLDIRCPI